MKNRLKTRLHIIVLYKLIEIWSRTTIVFYYKIGCQPFNLLSAKVVTFHIKGIFDKEMGKVIKNVNFIFCFH